MYSLLGRELAKTLLPCEGEVDGVRVHGFISSPAAGRGSRAQQHFFCNGRWIRSAALQAALEQAYRNTLLVGRFPACVLYVELSCCLLYTSRRAVRGCEDHRQQHLGALRRGGVTWRN